MDYEAATTPMSRICWKKKIIGSNDKPERNRILLFGDRFLAPGEDEFLFDPDVRPVVKIRHFFFLTMCEVCTSYDDDVRT